MRDGLSLVEWYFVEELNSHYGESLAREWLTTEKRMKIARALRAQAGSGMRPSRSQVCLPAASGQFQGGMRRSNSESTLSTGSQ